MKRALSTSLLAWLLACGATEDPVVANGAGGNGAPGDAGSGGLADSGSTGLPPSADASSSAGRDAGGVVAGGCTGTRADAPPASTSKVDIVWVVDASGSMLDEQKRIGANLTRFAESITQASVDVSISMLTTGAGIPVICPVVPPDPMLGTPLESDPRYHFLNTDVDSYNLLDVAVDGYDSYAPFLRPGASVQFVFVTDDESRYRNLMSADARADAFTRDMTAKLGHGFTAHTISSDGPTACNDPQCSPDANSGLCVFAMLGCGAANPGDTYWLLSGSTRGVSASICQSDWTGLFQQLQAGIIAAAPLPCDYTIPPPPSGETLDPTLVNVAYTAPGAAEQVLPKVGGAGACGNDGAWYYDDDTSPTKVLLCPAACTTVAAGGSMDIAFGCSTVLR